jgi:hypothetical protein
VSTEVQRSTIGKEQKQEGSARLARALIYCLTWASPVILGFSLLGYRLEWLGFGERTGFGRFVRSEYSMAMLLALCLGAGLLSIKRWQTRGRLLLFGFVCIVGSLIDNWYFATALSWGLFTLGLASIPSGHLASNDNATRVS